MHPNADKNTLPPRFPLVDDPLFRKTLVTTSRMDQTVFCMGKGVMFGKRDTTLSLVTSSYIRSNNHTSDRQRTGPGLETGSYFFFFNLRILTDTEKRHDKGTGVVCGQGGR